MEWNIIETFFRDNPMYSTKHQLDAYDDFIRNKLPRAIKQIPIVVTKVDEKSGAVLHRISVHIGGIEGKDIFMSKPVYNDNGIVRPLYPNDALVKSLYYASDIYAHVTVRYFIAASKKTKDVVFKDVRIGSVPIMVHSCLCVLRDQDAAMIREMGSCKFDQGGYFIADGGKEKVIVAQERIVTNRLFITKPDPDKADSKTALDAMIQCITEDDPFQKTVVMNVNSEHLAKRRNSVTVRMSSDIAENLPIFTAFRALGVESDRRILEHIVGDVDDPKNAQLVDFLYWSVIDNPHKIYTQTQALEYLKEFVRFKNVDHVRHIIFSDFLRNATDMRKKAIFFGTLVARLVRTRLDLLQVQSRDDFMNKRVDCSGVLMYDLFIKFYNNMRRDIRRQIERAYSLGAWYDKVNIEAMIKPSDIGSFINASIIDSGMKAALKGRWPGLETDPTKAGIVQDLNRVSYVGYQSHVRRLNTPMPRDLKLAEPRRLHPTQWGVTCPYQSPDGASIGLDKHLAVLTHITIDTDSKPIKACLIDLGCSPIASLGLATILKSTRVLVNNDLFAVTADPKKVVETLRLYRRNGLINAFVSVTWSYMTSELSVFTENGRLVRPLLIVTNHAVPALNFMKKRQSPARASASKPDPIPDAEQAGGASSKSKSARASTRTAKPVMIGIGNLSQSQSQSQLPHWKELFNGFNKKRDLYDESYVSPEKIGVTLEQLVKNQATMEFIDVEESASCLLAMTPHDIKANPLNRYTHCEIHPSTTLSLYTNTIPFANHNQAPRIVFSGAQGKQAIGVYATNFNIRMDTMTYVLHYPQRPLVTTRYNRYSNNDALPNGENLIVAVMTYTGYNQEDAIIVNRSSIESGMFNLTYLKSFLESEVNDVLRGKSTLFCNPHELDEKNVNIKLRMANILTVDENGMPKHNAQIDEDDLLLGKLNITTTTENGRHVTVLKDVSKKADKTIEGIIDRTIVFKDERGELNAKVRMRQFRMPMIGDKMASRHGQKGVCGIILSKEDMPFTASGVVPDIIINPHAMPSRMTIGHLLECVVAKAAVMGGFIAEGTAFEEQDIPSYGKILERNGFERHGNEVMYDGFTGEQIETDIFFGPTMYFRLKHQAADKINYRADGAVSTVTRQPVRGRAVNGGLRLGEQERDCLLASGISSFLKEAYVDKSDGFQFDASKLFGPENEDGGVCNLVMPYSMKQLLQEVYSIGIDARLTTTASVLVVPEVADVDDEDLTELAVSVEGTN